MHISSSIFRQGLFSSIVQSSGKLKSLRPFICVTVKNSYAIRFSIFTSAPINELFRRRKMPPIALSPSLFALPQSSTVSNPLSSSILNPQSPSTSNPRSFSIFVNPLWSLPPLSWGFLILALGILVLILRHRLTSRSRLHRPLKLQQTNPSADIQHPLVPNTAKSLQSISALPPPLPIPTIRRHSYPLTINSNSNINGNALLSPSSLPSPSPSPSVLVVEPSAKAKRCSGSRRHAGLIRQNTRENVNGCRRHVMVFQKSG